MPRWELWVRLFAMAMLSTALCGCETLFSEMAQSISGPSHQPANVHLEEEKLAPELKRVAILPLVARPGDSEAEFGGESLAPVLLAELAKAQRFELVSISAEQLRRITGRSHWTTDERLPWNFFERLREASGCDGVLFCRLTHYRAYQPLLIGWHLQLLDATEPRVLWSADEVFDASNPAVARAAQRYAQGDPEAFTVRADAAVVLQSPRRFGQYSASALAATLPMR